MRCLSNVLLGVAALSGGAVGDRPPPACERGACEAGDADEVSQLQLAPRPVTRPTPSEDALHDRDFPSPELFGESDPFNIEGLFRGVVDVYSASIFKHPPPRGTCKYADSSGECPRASLKDEYVNVYPGGETQCLDGSDFFFTFRRGDPAKLHIHFQGGGACWDFLSYNLRINDKHVCHQQVEQLKPKGILNKSNPENPWANYSFVIINYCSGDMHGGHSEHRWKLDLGKVRVRGLDNSLAAIQWAHRNFDELDQFTLSGSSAGSLAVQLWSRKVLDLFSKRSKDVTVVGDSFVGVIFPPRQQQPAESTLYKIWDLCQDTYLSRIDVWKCKYGRLLLADVWRDAMREYRNARFVALNSKEDFVQIGFEKAFEATQLELRGALMTKGQFYKYAALQLKEWYEEPNFHTYLVDGFQHTYLPRVMDTATPENPNGGSLAPTMISWLGGIVHNNENGLRTVCYGVGVPINRYQVARNRTDYCPATLAGVR